MINIFERNEMPLIKNLKKKPGDQPFQLLSLFNGFPDIDTPRLCQYIEEIEARSQFCKVSDFKISQRRDNKRVATGLISLSDLHIAIIIHEWPLPETIARCTIGASHWTNETKTMLLSHTCYALCTCVGEAKPIEKLIALYKVALGLINQGAIGIANEQTWSCYPAKVFEMLKKPGTWESLRTEGIPAELVIGFVKTEVEGQLWFLSKGHFLFGLPELAFKAQNHSQAEDLCNIFKNVFYYLFENGPIIRADDTMEIKDGILLRFTAPSPKQKFLESPTGMLVVRLSSKR